MEKTWLETFLRKCRDKSGGAQENTKGADAVSGNNKLVRYWKTSGKPEGKRAMYFAGFTSR